MAHGLMFVDSCSMLCMYLEGSSQPSGRHMYRKPQCVMGRVVLEFSTGCLELPEEELQTHAGLGDFSGLGGTANTKGSLDFLFHPQVLTEGFALLNSVVSFLDQASVYPLSLFSHATLFLLDL